MQARSEGGERGMSGAECKKKMYVDRPLFFLRLLRRACLALLTHFALAFALLQKREKNNACYAGY